MRLSSLCSSGEPAAAAGSSRTKAPYSEIRRRRKRSGALQHAIFGTARPRSVLVTTPNVEYNVRFETMPAGMLRHRDHRFEWTRRQFQTWANDVASRFGYDVTYRPVGDEDSHVGPPTQMAVFTR